MTSVLSTRIKAIFTIRYAPLHALHTIFTMFRFIKKFAKNVRRAVHAATADAPDAPAASMPPLVLGYRVYAREGRGKVRAGVHRCPLTSGGGEGFLDLDDNVKFVFDLTNVAPFKRVFTDMVVVDDHLSVAETEKTNSDAWRNFVRNDGMFSEFVPLVLGWYGEFGREFKNFVRRIADHYIGDAYAKEWRVRRILAQVQVKHLNLIGVYLRNVRAEYEVVGAARKSNRGLPKLILNGRI